MIEILTLITSVVDKIFPNKDKKDDREFQLKKELLAHELQKELQKSGLLQKQIEVNIEEAKHPNIFVSGWRPFIGWMLGTLLLVKRIIIPLMVATGVVASGAVATGVLDGNDMKILLGILGIM